MCQLYRGKHEKIKEFQEARHKKKRVMFIEGINKDSPN